MVDTVSGTGRRVLAVGVVLALVATAVASVPLAGAAPPESEPNDSRSEAQSIPFGETVTGEVSSDDDEDWYALDVEAGDSVNVSVTGTSGRAYFQLRNEDGQIRGDRYGTGKYAPEGETVSISAVASEDTTFYVRAYYSTGAYSFEARRVDNDDNEYDGDQGNATEIELGQAVDGRITRNDDDWYALDLEAGQSVRTDVSVPAAGSGEVYVQFRNDTEVLSGGGAVSNGKYVSAGETKPVGGVVEESGTYYVRVYYGQGDYSFTVETVANDPEEPNERQSSASPLFENPVPRPERRLTYNDGDWLYFPAGAGESLSLEASMPSDATGQVYFQFRNETATLAKAGTSRNIAGYARPDEPLSVSGAAKSPGRNYLRIYYGQGTGEERYTYDLRVGGERYGPPNDRFERANPPVGNQDPANATELDSGDYRNLGIVDDDRDVFAVDLAAGDRLRAAIEFAHAENDLALALADGSGTTVASSDSSSDGEQVAFTAPSAGTYYLTVSGEPGASTTYRMDLAVLQQLDVTLGPGGAELPPDTTRTVDVVVSDASAGLASANLTLRSTNASVLSLQSVEAAGTGSVAADVSSDGGTATANVTGLDAGAGETVTVATVTVRTTANGSATLAGNATLAAAGGLVYPPPTVQDTAVTVRPGDVSTATPTEPDDEGGGTDDGTDSDSDGTDTGGDDGTATPSPDGDSDDGGEGADPTPTPSTGDGDAGQSPTSSGGGGPGFGAVLAVLAVLTVAAMALRRQS